MTISSDRLRAPVWAAVLLMFLSAIAALPGTAFAQSLDALRAQGVVGERYDGTLVLRDSGASSAVQDFVQDANSKRKAIYAKRAAEQNVSPGQVGAVYAKEIMQNAPSGTWFLDASGNWRQK